MTIENEKVDNQINNEFPSNILAYAIAILNILEELEEKENIER